MRSKLSFILLGFWFLTYLSSVHAADKEKKTPEILKREIEIIYNKSVENPCYLNCDDLNIGGAGSIPEFIRCKSKEELDQYYACYRWGESEHNDYMEKYRPALSNLSSMMYKTLVEATNDSSVNEQAIDAVLKCNLYKESFHWRGVDNPDGASGLGQFTEDGLYKINNILSRISDYKELDFAEEIKKLEENYAADVLNANQKRVAFENEIKAVEAELATLPSNQENAKKIAELRKQKNKVADELAATDTAFAKTTANYTEEVAKLDAQKLRNSQVIGLKNLWESFWENYNKNPGHLKQPDLSKVNNWNPPTPYLMTTKDFLGNKKNYEMVFLYTALTILDDYFDLNKTVEMVCASKNVSASKQPAFVEKLLGATAMYNMGPYGFKDNAMTLKNDHLRFDEWINNIKKSDLGSAKKSENINHLISNKRCVESGKNQLPCDSHGTFTSKAEPNCNWENMPISPMNRSACQNHKVHMCINLRLRNYECTTK